MYQYLLQKEIQQQAEIYFDLTTNNNLHPKETHNFDLLIIYHTLFEGAKPSPEVFHFDNPLQIFYFFYPSYWWL